MELFSYLAKSAKQRLCNVLYYNALQFILSALVIHKTISALNSNSFGWTR